MRVLIDEEQLEDGAADWWKKITPAARAVLIQALWECGHGADDSPNEHENAIVNANQSAQLGE